MIDTITDWLILGYAILIMMAAAIFDRLPPLPKENRINFLRKTKVNPMNDQTKPEANA